MNEITLLRDYGPEVAPLSDEVLNAARARLTSEIAGAPRRAPLLGAARQVRVRVLAAAVVAAVALAGAVVVGASHALRSEDRPPAGITLVAFHTPVFPLALDPLPTGLKPPSFSAEEGRFLAVYLARHGDGDVYLSVRSRREAPVGQSRVGPVTVNGRPGEVWRSRESGGPAAVTLTWQRRHDQWVSITGRGELATEAAVRRLATAIVDRPQEVPLQIGLAPAGWELAAFKDDTILTLRDAGSGGPGHTLSVQRVAHHDPDLLRSVMGAQEVSPVRVGGREGRLVRAEEMWFLQAPLPDGSVFNLQAPLLLTWEQVIAIGEHVTVRR